MAFAWLRDWLARLLTSGFRERHDRMAEEARLRAEREGRIYRPKNRAYREVLGDYPHYWIHISTKGPDGRLMVEPVQTAWPLALRDVDKVEVKVQLVGELLDAYGRLRKRRAVAWGKRG